MIDYLDQTMSLNSLIWLFIVIFMLHDLEEIIAVEPWVKKNVSVVLSKIPGPYKKTAANMLNIKSYQFAVAVLLEFIFFIPATFFAAERESYFFFLAMNCLFFIHVFTHLGQSILLRRYTVGVVSAVFLVLPYTMYLFYRLTHEGAVTWNQIFISAPVGLIIIPLVLAGHELGKKLVP